MLRPFGRHVAFTIASLLAIQACNLGQAVDRPPAPPSTTSPAAAAVGIPVSATPVRFSIPEGLATGASAETIDVVTDQSGDGKYYVVAILPVSLPFLPADNNPGGPVPGGGVPFPSASASGSDFQSYYRQVTAHVDAATSDQFTPPLSVLDALVQSIQLGANP